MKLTETPPAYCSSCFGQYPDRRHVDLDAAWDGPMVNEDDGIRTSIDDLILCEQCLRDAAALIGLKDPDESAARAEELEAEAKDLIERNRGLEAYAESLKATIAAHPVAA